MLRNRFISYALVILGFGSDVVTVTTGTAGSAGNVAADLQIYFSARLLEVAELNTVLDQFADKQPVPSNSSKTIQFVREEKLSVATTPTQLTEGIPPDAAGLVLDYFTAVMEQYGYLIRLSDLAELTAKHPIVQKTVYLLGLQAAETYDQIIFNVLSQGTNVYRPNGKVSNATTTASDTLGYRDLIQLDAVLNDAGGRPFDSGDFVAVVGSQVYASLLNDPDFKASHQLNSPDKIWKGEVDALGGFRIVRSNAPAFAPTTQATSGAANKIYTGFAIARFAYQVSDLQNLRTYVVAPGGQYDPLMQSRKIGWKFAFKSIITNNNWIATMYSAGQNSINN
jgi:N4-gp56 family major capsid protein